MNELEQTALTTLWMITEELVADCRPTDREQLNAIYRIIRNRHRSVTEWFPELKL